MVVVEQPHSPNGGPKKSIALDQTGYGAVRRVHWGALDRTFPAPYSPGSALSVGNHCFGPQVQVPPLWAKKKSAKKAAKPNQRRGWPGGMPKGPWGPRGPRAEPGLRRLPVRRTGPPRCAPKRRLPPAAGRAATRRGPGIQTRRVSRIDYTHGPPWGPLGGP